MYNDTTLPVEECELYSAVHNTALPEYECVRLKFVNIVIYVARLYL